MLALEACQQALVGVVTHRPHSVKAPLNLTRQRQMAAGWVTANRLSLRCCGQGQEDRPAVALLARGYGHRVPGHGHQGLSPWALGQVPCTVGSCLGLDSLHVSSIPLPEL